MPDRHGRTTRVLAAVVALMALAGGACTGDPGGQVGSGMATTAPRPAPTVGVDQPGDRPPAPALPPAIPSRTELPKPLKAVWVHLFDNALKTRAGVNRVLDDAASAGVNAVFLQVVRRQDAYYGSQVLPPTPDPALAPSFDVLRAAVDGGRARGIQIHAWFTVATAWHESYRDLELPAGHITRDHGPGTADPWMTVSRTGAQSREYFDIGLPELHDHVAGVVADIAGRYAVDGVHLDYVRYDGPQWGYHPRALQRFAAETGYRGMPAPSEPVWAGWRRAQSRAIVERARAALAQARPQALLSAAVIAQGPGPGAAGGFRETRAFVDYAQDWAAWVDEGLLDLAVPMVYMRESSAEQAQWFRQWLAFAGDLDQRPAGAAVAAGVGGWLNAVAGAVVQAREALSRTSGVVVFSYQQDSADRARGSFLRELGGI
ncbi:MAG TPA: family 10 glycosylhydrolase [Acidimicrobiales bacterium]|nr:family 10 glycosylhydrolase [Acidimicrobiales bacterium]